MANDYYFVCLKWSKFFLSKDLHLLISFDYIDLLHRKTRKQNNKIKIIIGFEAKKKN